MNQWQTWLLEIGREGDTAFDIAGAALKIAARDRACQVSVNDSEQASSAGVASYLGHLDLLAAEVAGLGNNALSAGDRAADLCNILAQKHGYSGAREDYDNLENADLMSVIDRKRGLPVALGILYLHVARAQGWAAEGINFPGHFLIRLEGAGERVIMDPFNGGRSLDAGGLRALIKEIIGENGELDPRYYEPVSDREILVRLQNNIRKRAFKAGDIPRAIEVLYRLVLLEPDLPEFWYELGMLEVHSEHYAKGKAALEKSLQLLEQGPDTDEMRLRIVETLGEIVLTMK